MRALLLLFLIGFFATSCETDGTSSTNTDFTPGSGQGGSLARFATVGDYLYAVDGTKLKVFDIRNTSNPIYLSNIELNVFVETIFPRDSSTIFIGTTQGMFIYEVSNAPNLRLAGQYEHIVSCDPVVANQEHAFVTLRTSQNSNFCRRGVNQLDIVDIKDISQPQLVNTFPLINPIGLGLYGDTLLICDRGVKVFDVSDVNNLRLINAIEDIDAIDIIPHNDLMIITGSTGIKQYRYKNGNLTHLSDL